MCRFRVFWNGVNNELSRAKYTPPFKHVCVWSPERHHLKFLTIFIQRLMVDMGMKIVHLCLDMQLYDMAKQVCWNQPRKFQNIVVHPGGIFKIVIFSCIGP